MIDLSRACDSFLDSSWPFPRVTEVGVREARQQSSRWSIRPSLMAMLSTMYPLRIHPVDAIIRGSSPTCV